MESSLRVLSLPLFNRKNRPQFIYEENDAEITALFDTGAATPVWCSGEEYFSSIYDKAEKIDQLCEISGFGQKPIEANVYKIPNFVISSEGVDYCIRELIVAVCNYPSVGCDIVLSDTMFSRTDTFIHRIDKKYIEIFFEKSYYQCAVLQNGQRFSITTFAQDK